MVEKVFYWKPQPFQPKPVLVEIVDLNRTRPKYIGVIIINNYSPLKWNVSPSQGNSKHFVCQQPIYTYG